MIAPDAGPATPPPRRRILVVEDDSATGRGLGRLLEAQGFAVTVANSGESALAALSEGPPPDFILTDLQLPDVDGREVAGFARGLDPRPHVGLITGWDLDLSADDRTRLGIDWVLLKPLYLPDLVARLNEPHHSDGPAAADQPAR